MAIVYRSEVSYDATSFTVGNPGFYLSAFDANETWAIEARRDAGVGVEQFFFYANADPDPTQGSLVAGTNSQTGTDFSNYDGGGTLAIEKDQAMNELRFITPLGTVTKTLTSFGANDASVLRPKDLALKLTRTTLTVSDAAQVSFYDFFGSRGGSHFLGAACSDTDPFVFSGPLTSTNGAPANLPITADNQQTVNRFRLSLSYTYPADGTKSPTTNEWKTWVGGDNIGPNPFRVLLDAAADPISGNVYWVRVPNDTHRQVRFGYTDDGGVTLNESAVVDQVGDDYAYPTLDVDTSGRIWIFFLNQNDRTKIYSIVSENYGRSFTSPQTLDVTPFGTIISSLRQRFHPLSGVGLLVYRSLKTFDMRMIYWDQFDGSHLPVPLFDPHHEVMPMYGDSYPVIRFIPDFLVHIDYDDAAGLTGTFSETWGVDWPFFNPGGSASAGVQPYFTYSRSAGLAYNLYQSESSGDLKSFPSDNINNAETLWPAVTVEPALLQQYAGLAVGPGGKLYAFYQTVSGGIYDVHCKVSDNHGRVWSFP